MKLTILALALLLGSVVQVQAACAGMNFHLWNADSNTELRNNTPKTGDVLCAESFEFSISADPGNCSSLIQSARLIMGGKIRENKKENVEPYTLFGDDIKSGTVYEPFKSYQGNINGRDMDPGNYTITAKFFRNNDVRWFLDQVSANFTVVKC